MNRHFLRELRRQLQEAGSAGLVAILLLAVGGGGGLLASGVLLGLQQRLKATEQEEILVAALEGTADGGNLCSQLAPLPSQCQCAPLDHRAMSFLATSGLRAEVLPPLVELRCPLQEAEAAGRWLSQIPTVAAWASTSLWRKPLVLWTQRLLAVTLGLAALFVGGCLTVVVLAVRLLVLSHGEEVAIMRLIGAHEEDIRGPYLACGAVLGLMGGGGGAALAFGGRLAVATVVTLPPFPWWAYTGMVVGGMVLGLAGAGLGLRAMPEEQ